MKKTIKIKGKYEIEVKRFYLPFEEKIKCAHCGEEITLDLSQEYIFYPTINAKESATAYCDDCGENTSVDIVIGISITLDAEKVKKS